MLKYPSAVLGAALLMVGGACAARSGDGAAAPQERFWAELQALCGSAFPGVAVEAPETDETFRDQALVMHVRECSAHEVRIPLHVGDDRSRTWIVSRTPTGLRLKHDHRHRDGTADDNTDYGGDTADAGTAERQEFPADAFSVERVPARETQHWFLEIRPGETFAYGLLREATGLRYRLEFDLTERVPAPPAPWGH